MNCIDDCVGADWGHHEPEFQPSSDALVDSCDPDPNRAGDLRRFVVARNRLHRTGPAGDRGVDDPVAWTVVYLFYRAAAENALAAPVDRHWFSDGPLFRHRSVYPG